MYAGISEERPKAEPLESLEITLSRGYHRQVDSRLSRFQDKYDSLKLTLRFAFENIEDHGSGRCVFSYGIDTNGCLVVWLTDEDGGFDPREIRRFKQSGEGYKEFCRSQAEVSHSPDGRSTYLVGRP